MARLHLGVGCLLLLRAKVALVEAKELVKGISYGPMPCRLLGCNSFMNEDDFMSEQAKPLWGPGGRHDLKVIRELGANQVRMYGNNPDNDHRSFLDEAHKLGLGVVVGVSDYPYTQMQGHCMSTQFDCFQQVKAAYLENLQKGFLLEDGTYHPALRQVIAVNEPDLKVPGMGQPRSFIKAILSGIDGMLSAEQEANVTGLLPNFTATFSFGICSQCRAFRTLPALGQMHQLRSAMWNPKAYGYTPRNNLQRFYRTRFTNSFNTANPAKDVQEYFLKYYEVAFRRTPVVIQEYHKPRSNVTEDLLQIMAIANSSKLLQGISFFEFQVRYDKGGAEEEFGMFRFGDYSISTFDYFGAVSNAWCLVPADAEGTRVSMPAAVAMAYGRAMHDNFSELCVPDPLKVPLSQAGYLLIAAQRSTARMAPFAERVVKHLGGVVVDAAGLRGFAAHYAATSTGKDFGGMVSWIAGHRPPWASWASPAYCVADRLSNAGAVGSSISWACGSQPLLDCAEVPDECRSSVWDVADYIFGAYYLVGNSNSPLEHCYFAGAAVYAAVSVVQQPASKPTCLPTEAPPPRTTTTTTSTITSTTRPPFAGNCSFREEPTLGYFWDLTCVRLGGGLGCFADGLHLACRWCGFGALGPCPTLPPPPTAAEPQPTTSAALRGAARL